MELKLTLNLADLDLSDVIKRKYDDDTTVGEEVVRELVRQIAKGDEYASLERRVHELRDEEIRSQIAPLIADALSVPIERTNTFGEPIGKSTTLREVIVAEAKKYWSEPFDSYNSRDKGPKLAVHIRKEVEAAFQAEIADAVKVARDAVAKQAGASIGDVVTTAVRTALSAR